MSSSSAGGNVPIRPETTVERVSPREVVVTRTFDAPARLVFAAWTRAELFERWWVPRSLGMKLLSCELDVRPGGSYRLVFDQGDAEPIAFFGTYLEVVPDARLVWTNEEGGEPGPVTTGHLRGAGRADPAGHARTTLLQRVPGRVGPGSGGSDGRELCAAR